MMKNAVTASIPTIKFKRGLSGRLVAHFVLLVGVLLVGCSSLQIDVDVYKGSLSNEPEIQLQQYASKAIAAESLITRFLDTAAGKVRDCVKASGTDGTSNCDDAEKAWQFLREILALYEDRVVDEKVFKSLAEIRREETSQSNDGATKFLSQSKWVQKRNSEKGLRQLTQDFFRAMAVPLDRPDRDSKLAEATARLNEALIFFAEKILFSMNQQALFRILGSVGDDELKAQAAVMQSLGNTILVHANDLQRQLTRKTDQKSHAASERGAVQSAMTVDPPTAFDQIMQTLRGTAQKAMSAALPSAQEREQLQKLESALMAAQTKRDEYLKGLSPLVAAYRTLVGEPDASLGVGTDDATGKASAQQDRATIAELYSAEKNDPAGLQPLLAWLAAEQTPGVAVSPSRPERLKGTGKYFSDEEARLAADGVVDKTPRPTSMNIIRRHIEASWALAILQISENSRSVATLAGQVEPLQKSIAAKDTSVAAKKEADAQALQIKTDNDKAVAVLQMLRKNVLEKADRAGTANTAGVLNLLKIDLAAMTPVAGGAVPNQADIDLARLAVGKLHPMSNPSIPCGVASVAGDASYSAGSCPGDNQLDVIDGLIATLRAQRVVALASGNKAAAEDLLSAITAAYDQRTEMVYLRPASAYLSSVYSASDLQDNAAPEHRNMLMEYFQYLWPAWLRTDTHNNMKKARQQLEKLFWQNINTVKLNGGGATNYVLAKDDVGNWYVKAYGSDPEPIIKSATSLALFNTGKGFNTNLLRRYDLQRQIDDPENKGDKAVLRAELEKNNSQDGVPLLKVRNRYAIRYMQDTEAQATAMRALLTDLPSEVDKKIVGVGTPDAGCKAPDVKEVVQSANSDNLEPRRGKLEALLKSATAPAGLGVHADDAVGMKAALARTRELEGEMQLDINGLLLYAGQLYRALNKVEIEACAMTWRSSVADKAREVSNARLRAFATTRMQSIERYEDALTNIAGVAVGN